MWLARRVVGARRSMLVCCAITLLFLLIAASGLWYTLSARSWTQMAGRTWRIGFHDTEPFIFRGPDGKPAGFAREVLTEAASTSGIQLRWVASGIYSVPTNRGQPSVDGTGRQVP